MAVFGHHIFATRILSAALCLSAAVGCGRIGFDDHLPEPAARVLDPATPGPDSDWPSADGGVASAPLTPAAPVADSGLAAAVPARLLRLEDLDGTEGSRWIGKVAGDRWGQSVACGDLDHDGRVEVLIGAPGFDGDGAEAVNAGAVLLVPAEVLVSSAAVGGDLIGLPGVVRITGEQRNDGLGRSIEVGNDLDGDGVLDPVACAGSDPFRGQTATGLVYVLDGRAVLVGTAASAGSRALHRFTGSAGDRVGFEGSRNAVVIGDFDDDRVPELAIGLPRASTGGEVRIFAGGPGMPAVLQADAPMSALMRITTNNADDRLGIAVGRVGDIDGDGRDDLLVGADRADRRHGVNEGAAYLIFGGTTRATLPDTAIRGDHGLSIFGEVAHGALGAALTNQPGDFDGDGYLDFAVGSPGQTGATATSDRRGGVLLVYGGPSLRGRADAMMAEGIDATEGLWLRHGRIDDLAGAAVSMAGDLDGDGRDDLLIAAPGATDADPRAGRIYVVYGRDRGASVEVSLDAMDGGTGLLIEGGAPSAGLGESLAVCDLNGDGRDDLVIGAPAAGQAAEEATGAVYVVYGTPR